jgi:hypothetical protein
MNPKIAQALIRLELAGRTAIAYSKMWVRNEPLLVDLGALTVK